MASLLALPRPVIERPATVAPETLSLGSLQGRLCEVSALAASACVTLAMQWVLEAQLGAELAAWVQVTHDGFFPPDVAAMGIDLAAFPVAEVPHPTAAARAAEQLLRSGGFALVVIDTVGVRPTPNWPIASQSRLLGLAQKHDAAVVFLNDKTAEQASIGSLVSLRVHASKHQLDGDRFAVDCAVLKDKRLGPGAQLRKIFHGPAGIG